ncbi:MAG TPA: LLM class flavin-dependent oxidoreductase [Candidatus Dormibacteraeota bacterium]
MRDYGRPLRFGWFPTPDAMGEGEVLRLARLADELGLDLIGIQDHPYQARFLETWTLLTAIAAQTRRISVFPDVANLPLRPPALLAKAAATLDLISDGRVELGLGAGAFPEGVRALGGPVRRPGEAVAALEEAIQVIRMMWSGTRGARFDGKHYRLNGAHTGPPPAHPIEIWLGAYRPRMLELTGRLADGWIPSVGYLLPAQLPEAHSRIDEAAVASGRDPSSIRRLYNVSGSITDGPATGPLYGPASRWVETLTELTMDLGMDSYVLAAAGDAEVQLRRFALEVAPAVRESVTRARTK